MKTQLVSAIHLQQVELQEKPTGNSQGNNSNSNNGEFDDQVNADTSGFTWTDNYLEKYNYSSEKREIGGWEARNLEYWWNFQISDYFAD